MKTFSTIGYRLRLKSLSGNEGSAALEYAVVLGLVAAGLLCLSFQVSIALDSVFDQVASSFGESSAVAAPGADDGRPAATLQRKAEKRHIAFDIALLGFLIVALGGWMVEWRSRIAKPIVQVNVAPVSGSVAVDPASRSRNRFAHKRLRLLQMMVQDCHKLLPSDLKVADLMTTEVTMAAPSTTAAELRVIIEENHFRHILICTDDGKLVGIVSDRDLRNVPDSVPARAVMAENPTTVGSDTLVSNAITLLLYGNISSLPVVDAGRLIGILTTTDIVMTLQCSMLALEQMARNLHGEGHCDLTPAVA